MLFVHCLYCISYFALFFFPATQTYLILNWYLNLANLETNPLREIIYPISNWQHFFLRLCRKDLSRQ
jgi:hypothetical protein